MAAHNHLYPKEHISEAREVADHAIVESQQLRQAAGGSMKQWTKRLNLNLVTERLHEDLEFKTHTMLISWIQAEKNHTNYKLYVGEINPKEQVGTAFYDQLSPWTETPCRLTTRGTRLKNKTNKDPATSVTLPSSWNRWMSRGKHLSMKQCTAGKRKETTEQTTPNSQCHTPITKNKQHKVVTTTNGQQSTAEESRKLVATSIRAAHPLSGCQKKNVDKGIHCAAAMAAKESGGPCSGIPTATIAMT
ncbi:hypothetical protein SELMODRAFT_404607 [Selaginella moellendorffii]|uniref:Uncharacterized protein n=1 Tax=Selaginella moellendorffii TaxID=88036 RepID=D8QVV3_SELML|nr:hypothetical protein SELMODRAFT_404607 [Selaginella moellendorffii]